MTHLTVTPQGATALTERGFDDPNFQRCDGCDSGFIVEEPDQYWPCPYCSHSNAARPKAGAVCPSAAAILLMVGTLMIAALIVGARSGNSSAMGRSWPYGIKD